MKAANTYSADLVLPAYSRLKELGHLFKFILKLSPSEGNSFDANGELGSTLLNELERVLNILYRTNPIWQMLTGKFFLEGKYDNFIAGDTTSAGLGIAIALFNLARSMNGSCQTENLVGTGFIRFSGHVDIVDGIDSKSAAVIRSHDCHSKLITANDIWHLKQLDQILVRYC